MGWPGTNREWTSCEAIGPFTPATSVTTRCESCAAASSSSRRATGTTADAGVATNAMSASPTGPMRSIAPSSERAGRPRLVKILAAHFEPTGAKPEPDRRADQPEADHVRLHSGRSSRSERAPSKYT